MAQAKPGSVSKIITGAFGNLEVKDADTPLLLVPIDDDFEAAIRKDPKNCGLTRCVHRMFGSTLALFFKTCAYIDIVGEDGTRCVWRYAVSEAAFKQLSAFDRAEHVKTGRAIKLLAPQPCDTLAAMRKKNTRWRRSDVGKTVTAERAARSALLIVERQFEKTKSIYQEAKSKHAPSSPALKTAEKQKQTAATALRQARDRVATTAERAKKLRSISFRPSAPAKPRKFDLTVRNASGFFTRPVTPHPETAVSP